MSARDASAATLGGTVGGILVGLLARADMRLVALIGAFRRALPEPGIARARRGYRLLAAPALLSLIVLPLMLLMGVLQVLGAIPVPPN